MRIDNRIFESYTVEFNSPLTDEDWEELEDIEYIVNYYVMWLFWT